ncbi:hypothetical protein [Gimesia aquarii]|uniref:Uncharacterized protein n=1 Tax=Gimesia aquarii TaxID=2527964 RepID=A0A517W3Q6_9PLAN|nr:hypothetical protein [Gimesia aquarii]QDT99884.1 hypothetical protein V144x_53980 [Gimesia aquarii]
MTIAETSTDPKIIAALVIASFSLLVTVVNIIWNYLTQTKLEILKSDLANSRAMHDARLDYEYEARKRLYHECEPIFFQLNESANDTKHRVISLARTSRLGHLGLEDDDWLTNEGYYSISTYYNLFIPLAHYKQIREALTLIDLNVDKVTKARYDLIKWLYICWTDDFELARLEPALSYEPNIGNWLEQRNSDPRKYWRQGLPIGRLDSAVESLLTRLPDHKIHVKSYGEFESDYKNKQSEVSEGFSLVRDIFHGFDPRTRPILWRCLLVQSILSRAIIESSKLSRDTNIEEFKPIRPFTKTEIRELDWRNDKDDVSERSFLSDFEVAFKYVKTHLPHLCQSVIVNHP